MQNIGIYVFLYISLFSCNHRNTFPEEYYSTNFVIRNTFKGDYKIWKDVFKQVLISIKNKKIVYPGETYLYFRLSQNDKLIKGNIRFAHNYTMNNQISFTFSVFQNKEIIYNFSKVLISNSEIQIIKNNTYKYEIIFKNIKREFRLYNAAQLYMKDTHLLDHERYIMPIVDESGVWFQLIFDINFRMAFYHLVDNKIISELKQIDTKKNLYIHEKTKFKFQKDKEQRFILSGVSKLEQSENTLNDGPCDQSAEYLILDKNYTINYGYYLQNSYPSIINKIDNFGNLVNDKDGKVCFISYELYN